ncbi:aminodeoxychorismate synthase component I [Desulfopila sp. IMCC35008]|uniref:aminodeoxychorismate synthase component I n=1 Tax=Desulfopila sp. IMCC35008 TaxID=2653858 RepID=UPI0013D38292|nr:aminodeoxychorismate synthase component I [Desulfopila sp. IMCC35008]
MYTVPDSLLKQLLGYFAQTEQFAFFDTSRPCLENSASYLFTSPVKRLKCSIDGDGYHFLNEVQLWLDKGYWVAGWFGYEFGYLLDRQVSGLTTGPGKTGSCVADLGVFEQPHTFNHVTGVEDFSKLDCTAAFSPGTYSVQDITPNITEQDYLDALKRVKEYICAGDTYQVNLTLKLLFGLSGSPESLYRDLRRNQSVAYGAYVRWGDERVMSFSPELFFRKNVELLTARPMKGTLKRGRTLKEDQSAREFLQNDGKNRSENVMIVDLLRNDLGRVLHETGGGEVTVRSLFDVETYEGLLQMTSTVHGRGNDRDLNGISLATLFKGLFPCGSVTGAPKIRTMEIIAELEKEYRGVYTGAIGFFGPDGSSVFNVPIRTVVLNGERGEMGIGSGVTHDSDSGDEWQECLLKGKFLTDPVPEFKLIETLLWEPKAGFWLLERHLQRLGGSAEYYYFSYDRDGIERALQHCVEGLTEPARVRLTLAKDGTFELTTADCKLPGNRTLPECPVAGGKSLPRVRFSKHAVDSTQTWQYHKTTMRSLYDEEFVRACAEGCLDYLFVNESGEVTEGAITNIIIYKDGSYLTPPASSGLLKGVMIQELMGLVEVPVNEQVLYPHDILGADALYCCNSVRGVIRVQLIEG